MYNDLEFVKYFQVILLEKDQELRKNEGKKKDKIIEKINESIEANNLEYKQKQTVFK